MKQRVLFVSHQADFIYGAEVCILEALRAASPECEAEFAAPRGPFFDRAAALVPAHAIPSREFHRSLTLFFPTLVAWLRTWRALFRLVHERKISVVHAITLKSMVYAWPLLFHRVPLFWHHHDILPETLGNRVWLRIIAFAATAVIVPSRATAKALIANGVPKQKVFVVPNGFALDSWTLKAEIGKTQQEILRLGIIGEISYRKGLDRLRPLIEILVNRVGLNFEIHVIGASLSEPDFANRILSENERFAERGLVRFWGRQENVAEHLQRLDVLLLLSRQDPLPTVIIEAALSGVPTIGFPVGGVPEMIESGKTGVLVDSVAELADAVIYFSLHPAQINFMGRAARAFAEQQYSAKRMVESFVAIYRSSP